MVWLSASIFAEKSFFSKKKSFKKNMVGLGDLPVMLLGEQIWEFVKDFSKVLELVSR